MDIIFRKDKDGSCNVEFFNRECSNNEVIIGIFFDFYGEYAASCFLEDYERICRNEMPHDEQMDYDFSDFISGKLTREFVLLVPDGPIDSRKYHVETESLVMAIKKWQKFISSEVPNSSEVVSINASAVD